LSDVPDIGVIDIDPADVIAEESASELAARTIFHSHTLYEESHPRALAVYCSDGRFTQAVEELLTELGHPRIDTLTIPGGAALLHLWSAAHSEAETVRRSASFLISGHRLTNVVLVAHEGCGYYRARFPSLAPEPMLARQILDLQRAAGWIRLHHPDITVMTFFAQPESGTIVFQACPT